MHGVNSSIFQAGKSVFGGIAIGKICVYRKGEQQVKRVKTEDTDDEMQRYTRAKEEAVSQLKGLYDKAVKEVGEANAAIFEIHQMMLEDDDYNESVDTEGQCRVRRRSDQRQLFPDVCLHGG